VATIEDALYTKLAGTGGVAAVVGTRIYRLKMPDNPTFPAITFEVSSGQQIESFTGYSGLSNPIMSVHCWARSATVAQQLAITIRDAIVGQSWTYSDRTVANVLEWSTTDLFDDLTDVYHVSASFRIWYH
jgi:hypothetical protein